MITRQYAQLAISSKDVVGEGPVWDAATHRLLWSDNQNGLIHCAIRDDSGVWRESQRWILGRRLAAAIPRMKGGLVVAAGMDILTLDELGRTELFVRIHADRDNVELNDAKCDPHGRLWAGTHASDFRSTDGALYRIDTDGCTTLMLDNVSVSNGLDWSPDGSTFYYIDSIKLTVDAFDFDGWRGTISNRRTAISIARGEGAPDGMTVDAAGDIWVAVVGAGEVRRYSPAGQLLARVAISHPGVTSCTFGGADLRDLLITSLGRAMPAVALELGFTPEMANGPATAPEGGALFVCRPGAMGKPPTPFGG